MTLVLSTHAETLLLTVATQRGLSPDNALEIILTEAESEFRAASADVHASLEDFAQGRSLSLEKYQEQAAMRRHFRSGAPQSEITCKLRLQWSQENQVGLVDGHLVFGSLPTTPGLYRMRIRYQNGMESRYVGETENLRRRFAHYRHPGPTQATNIRLNGLLCAALVGGEAVSLSYVVTNAWITLNGEEQAADFSNKKIRLLFENFALVAESDDRAESLNR